MKLIVTTKEDAAKQAAELYRALLRQKQNAVLGFATGSTPLALYTELIRAYQKGEISFQHAVSFNLDEYAGLDENHPQSYRAFMNKNLFSRIDIPMEHTHVPNGKDTSAEQMDAYEAMIRAAGGIDLQLLGIGQNGHIGFNEPGTPFDSTTHVVRLSQSTRNANARFFSSIDEVPKEAVSMGIKTVMNARAILLFAQGASKAKVVAAAVNGPVAEKVPASILQLHPDVTLYLDPEAAKYL
ncbi:MAG: glucosamine-6-phosphate deaminase [Eubacteriales bacterium]|nr:glucosamine-6-phosphate deaminase [Eubacteriales bacterium]